MTLINELNPMIKSVVITPTSAAQDENTVKMSYKTIMNCVIKDKSLTGTNKFSWIGSDFSKYLKVYGVQLFGAQGELGSRFIDLTETGLSTAHRRSLHGRAAFGDAPPDDYNPQRIRNALLEYTIPQAIRDFGFNQNLINIFDSDRVETPDDKIILWSSTAPRHKVGVAQIERHSLSEIKSNRGFAGPNTYNDETTSDINFRFEFDLSNIDTRNGIALHTVRHLVFIEFDYLQAFADAGVSQPLQFDVDYERRMFLGFSEHLSTDARILRSIVEGRKLPTLDYFVIPGTGEIFSGSPFQDDTTGLWWDIRNEGGNRRLHRRSIRNDKVHYLDPRSTLSSPSPSQARAQRNLFHTVFEGLDDNVLESRRNQDSDWAAGKLLSTSHLVARDELQRRLESQHPLTMKVGDSLNLTLTVRPELALAKSRYFRIINNLAKDLFTPSHALRLSNGLYGKFLEMLTLEIIDLRVFKERVDFIKLDPDYKNNRVVRSGEKEDLQWETEDDLAVFVSEHARVDVEINDGHLLDAVRKNPYSSFLYSAKITALDPVGPILREMLGKVNDMLIELENFYNTATIPSFGLKTETTAGLYGLGQYRIREEDQEYPGSVDLETDLYTEDFVRSSVASTFNSGINRVDGPINVGINNYLYLMIIIYGVSGLIEDPDRKPEEVLKEHIQGFIRVSATSGPKTLGMFIEEVRRLKSFMEFGTSWLTNRTSNLEEDPLEVETIEVEKVFYSNLVSVDPVNHVTYYRREPDRQGASPRPVLTKQSVAGAVDQYGNALLITGDTASGEVDYDFTI